MTTPRAAAAAGVLFALLFGATLILIRVKMPEGVGDSAEWLDSQKDGIYTATKLMPLSAAKTYAIRMAAVLMISLATIWLKTGLMPRWLVAVSYLVALGLLIAGDVSMWLTLAFPAWVLVVSALILLRAGYIDEQRAARE